MLLRKSHLSFEKIAAQWARELDDAKTPGRLNRDEILLGMVCGIWRSEFENAALTIEQAPRFDIDGRKYKPQPMRVTRETLDEVVLLRPGVRQRDPAVSRWEFLAPLKLEDYEPRSLRIWLEPLTISKEDFGRWCDDHEHPRPAFWFGLPDHSPPSADELQLRTQAERNCYNWLAELGNNETPDAKNTKDKLFQKAQQQFGVSRRAFDDLWRHAMPSAFKAPGARKTGS